MTVEAVETVQDAVLKMLDFTYNPPCEALGGCKARAKAIVKFLNHEECRAHSLWYAACGTHLQESLNGEALCHGVGCQRPLQVKTTLYL